MFQDIAPHRFCNDFSLRQPLGTDYILISKGNKFLLDCSGENAALPRYAAVKSFLDPDADLRYLFSVDDIGFFLTMQSVEETEGFCYHGVQAFRQMEPQWLAFACATAAHLTSWYGAHKYCGRCASKMQHSETERAVCCPECGIIDYPKISPAIIVGITDGERIVMSKYANAGYKRYSLIAGFMEIGETFEDTIRREVMEEVGLKVKNFRYYKSQPWAFSESILAGFFADLDGDDSITLDETELSEALWVKRDEIPHDDSTFSLTWDMIEAFRAGKF